MPCGLTATPANSALLKAAVASRFNSSFVGMVLPAAALPILLATPRSAPPAAPPAPVAAPVAQEQPEPGWTLEHVKGMAKAFLTNPKGGPDKLEEVLKRHGAAAVGTASPGVWHLLYADMAAILEAA